MQELGELGRHDDAQGRVHDHAGLNETNRATVDARRRVASEQADQEDIKPLQCLLQPRRQGTRQREGDDLAATLGPGPAPDRIRDRGHVTQQQPPRGDQNDDERKRPRDRHEGQRPGQSGREGDEQRTQARQEQVLDENVLAHVAQSPQGG